MINLLTDLYADYRGHMKRSVQGFPIEMSICSTLPGQNADNFKVSVKDIFLV